MPLRRAGTQPRDAGSMGPGSAAHDAVKGHSGSKTRVNALVALRYFGGRWAELAAPDRRHGDLIERAGLLVDLRAIAEFQVLAHADAHFAQSLAVAGHGDP